ncbi:MAG: class I SAM-dependent RNA methyltransferase, partial [Pseudomonadota bacterium]
HVLSPDLTRVIPALQELVGKVGSRKATVEMTVTATQTGLDLDVTGAPPPEAADLGWFAHWARTSGIVRLSWAGEAVLEEAAPRVTFGEYPVTPPPGAFLQATPDGEAALVSAVQGALGGVGKTVDLFGGCGTFALSVLPDRDVHLVEGDAALTTAALDAWKARSGGPILTTETRDLFRNPLDVDDLRAFEAAIIDPPRAGAAAQTQMLADSAVHQIASVSCNPVTFARDARALTDAGFTLDWVDVVDQFRWS